MIPNRIYSILAGLFMGITPPAHGAENILIEDFEGVNYGTWQTTGTAFNAGPARRSALATLEITNAVGNGVACSENLQSGSSAGNDGPQGRLTSPEFTIQRSYISFRIGGGDYELHCCMNLLVDGKIVKSATGRYSDAMYQASWDVSKWSGKAARIEIVDEASGGWGHILVDQLVQTDAPEVFPVVTTPVYEESARPVYHFTARQWTMDRLDPGQRQEGWINDLNGMIYYEGEYHMFAQRWNKCWIHAVSTDLVHWEELEPAFWEQTLGAGVQSGHCVIDYKNTSGLGQPGGEPPMVAFWSHTDNLTHGITYSLDKGRTWQYYPDNPILQFPERDPKVFWHEPTDKWVMVMYGSGKYHIFTSDDLLNWTDAKHPIPDAYECPDFFEMSVVGSPEIKKWILIHADGKYSLGSFNGTDFTEETPRLLSDIGGEAFYAAQTFENVQTGDGRRIQLAWMRSEGPNRPFQAQPFSQQISFPCELTLHQTSEGLRLFRKPAREIKLLEGKPEIWSCQDYGIGESTVFAQEGDAYRIQASVGNFLRESVIKFRVRGSQVILRKNSLEVIDAGGGSSNASITIPDDVSDVELLVDRASLEVFINDGQISCTRNLIPSDNTLSVVVEGNTATVHSVRMTPLSSLWNQSKTSN